MFMTILSNRPSSEQLRLPEFDALAFECHSNAAPPTLTRAGRSQNLALNQELIELDHFHNGLARKGYVSPVLFFKAYACPPL